MLKRVAIAYVGFFIVFFFSGSGGIGITLHSILWGSILGTPISLGYIDAMEKLSISTIVARIITALLVGVIYLAVIVYLTDVIRILKIMIFAIFSPLLSAIVSGILFKRRSQ